MGNSRLRSRTEGDHGPAGLLNAKAQGPRPLVDEVQRTRLLQVVEDGPIPAIHGVVRWRRIDLMAWIVQEFRVSI